MWDPYTVTDTTWLTNRITSNLGNSGAGVAMFNNIYSNYYYDAGTDTYWATEHTDLYTPTIANQVWRLTGNSTSWAAGYSTTVIPKSTGSG